MAILELSRVHFASSTADPATGSAPRDTRSLLYNVFEDIGVPQPAGTIRAAASAVRASNF